MPETEIVNGSIGVPAPRTRSVPTAGQGLRVLHVVEAAGGGIRTYLAGLLPEQVSRGYDVHLLAATYLPSWTSVGLPSWPGVRSIRWRLDRSRPYTIVPALRELQRAIEDVRPDVVHLHSALAGLAGRLLPVPRGSGPVRVYQPHAWSFDMTESRTFGLALRGWERNASRRTDVLVTNCTDEIERGRRLGVRAPQAHVIGVPLRPGAFGSCDPERRRTLRAELGLGEVSRVLVCVGRLARQKGQDLLVREWERRAPADAALVLVGGGETDHLRSLAPRQWGRSILAVGEQADVRSWLWAADLLVLPSRYETVSFAVAEALSAGLPVVATRADGVAEAVVDGPLPAAGAVVDLGDMEALLDASEERLSDPDLLERESAAALIRAEALFHPTSVADHLDTAYRSTRKRATR